MPKVGDLSSSSMGFNLSPSTPRVLIEFPTMFTDFKLTRYNLIQWLEYIREVMTQREMLHHLINSKPDPSSHEFVGGERRMH